MDQQAKVHAARVVGGVKMQEAAAGQKRCVDAGTRPRPIAAVLGVIEEVERFRAELEPNAFVDGETLKEAEVEVQTSGQCKSVAAAIAESESRGGLEGLRMVKRRSTLHRMLVRGEPSPGGSD